MRFLLASLHVRRRRIELEELLLLATRCLIPGLLAVALARPFVPPGSPVSWGMVLPAFVLGIVALAAAVVLRSDRRWSRGLLAAGVVLLLGSAAAVIFAHSLNRNRFVKGGRDVAVVIDASTSMLAPGPDGRRTLLETAVAEARDLVERAPGGAAFSVVLAGPRPEAAVPSPTLNRTGVIEALDAARPLRGGAAAFDALAQAVVSLADGANPHKEIVVLTDGQRPGWELENAPRWESLVEGAGLLPVKPRLHLRRIPPPDPFRNVAVTEIGYSRAGASAGRPVVVEVTIENTGSEAVTPEEVTFQAGESAPKSVAIGELAAGARRTLTFEHTFANPGSHVISVGVVADDHLPADNVRESICQVSGRIGVLIVDGNPAAGFAERASGYLGLATGADTDRKEPGEETLLDATIASPAVLSAMESLREYRVIVLADVPRLADSTARRIEGWVRAGGGLLVLPGRAAETDFYNQWEGADGLRLLPAMLLREEIAENPVAVDAAGIRHDSIRALADPERSDLNSARLFRYWRLSPAQDAAGVAELADGNPFLAGRPNGAGMVVMSCAAFDSGSGNLVTRRAFVPLVHQLVYYLANPSGQSLNLAPGSTMELPLGTAATMTGLRGEYFRGPPGGEPLLVRIDSGLSFNYGNRAPAEGVPPDFSARWTGALIPRYSEEYLFEAWGDDRMSLWIDGRRIIEGGGDGSVPLQAGRSHELRVEFADESGGAAMEVHWRSRSQAREPIPAVCLVPFIPGQSSPEISAGSFEAAGPDGEVRTAEILFTRSGRIARVAGSPVSGTYRIRIPADRADEFAELTDDKQEIPFVVADDPSESRPLPLGEAELDFIGSRFELIQAPDMDAVLNVLEGGEYGEELWQPLAIGVLLFLLVEAALARWIAVSRNVSGAAGMQPDLSDAA